MAKQTPKLKVTTPISTFDKPLVFDLKQLFKGLAKGAGNVIAGKWEELGNDAVETLSSIGLTSEPGELASLLIRRSLTKAIFDLVGEIAPQFFIDADNESSALEEQAISLIEEKTIYIDYNFLDRPSNIPLITEVQANLEKWLTLKKVPLAAAQAISGRLQSYFVYALNQEWRKNEKSYQPLLKQIDTPFTKAGEREWAWAEYSSYLSKRIQESIFDEPFSLAQLYIPLNAYYVDSDAYVSSTDANQRCSKPERRIVVSLVDELEQWLLQKDPQDAIRIISGGPGSGKSSFAKIFAAQIAKSKKIKVLFVPLHLIDPTKDIIDEIARFTKAEGILIQNPLDQDSPEPNLLLIFDGLDELSNQGKAAAETARAFIRETDRTVEKRNLNGLKLRVLFSGRELVVQENESSFRKPKQILNLLPYYTNEKESHIKYIDPHKLINQDLRHQWWKNYGQLSGKDYPGLPKAINRNDLVEITSQPLLNYLVALSFSRGEMDFKKDINLNFIYSDLIAAVYQRGYDKRRTYGPIKHMTLDQFNRVLEEVGLAAWHGDGRSTTVKEIEEHCHSSGVGNLLASFQEGARAGVTRLLAAFFFRQNGQRVSGDPTFVFTHKSFGEYLTARRIVRATERIVRELTSRQKSPDEGWDENEALRHWIMICGRSAFSTYLHTFLYNEVRTKNSSEIEHWQLKLSDIFSYILKCGSPMETIQTKSFRDAFFMSRNAEEAILVVLNSCARFTKQISNIKHSEPTAFGFWLKRIQGQRTGPSPCLALRCLSYLNLEGVYLDIADLFRSNLEYSNLSNVNANITCFEQANLSHVNLRGALMWRANLREAALDNADLTQASLNYADLRDASLAGVDVSTISIVKALIDGVTPEVTRQHLKESMAHELAKRSHDHDQESNS